MFAHDADIGPKISCRLTIKSPAKILPRWRGWNTATAKNIEDGNVRRRKNVRIRHIRETRAEIFNIGPVQHIAASHVQMISANHT